MRILLPSILLVLVLSACSNSSDSKQTVKPDPDSASQMLQQESQSVLPPLEMGVIELTEDDFGEVIELTGEAVNTEVIFNPKELEMFVSDHRMIMKSHTDKGLIKIISLPDFSLIDEIGVKGKGPGELMWPMIFPSVHSHLFGYAYDQMQEKLFTLDTAGLLTELPFILNKEEGQLFGSKQFFEYAPESFYYVSNSPTGKGIYQYLPNQGDSVALVYDLEEGFKKNLGWAALIGDFGGNAEVDRMVFAYKYFHKIRFFDYLQGHTRTLTFNTPTNPKAQSRNPSDVLAPTSITHFWGMSPQSDHVYCLYSGRAPLQVTEEMKAETDHIFVEQYDWNGNPVRKYRLDHWGYFCVDEATRTIYVAAVNASEPLYRYRF